MMKPALEMITPLDVLVIASDRETASWGDIATSMAIPRGVRGAIVDGAVRDVDRIASTDSQSGRLASTRANSASIVHQER